MISLRRTDARTLLERLASAEDRANHLVLGPRGIGKSSLLASVRTQLGPDPRLLVVSADLQGTKSTHDLPRLRVERPAGGAPRTDHLTLLKIGPWATQAALTPLVLLNEVDGVLEEEPVVRALCELVTRHGGRLIVSGHVAARAVFHRPHDSGPTPSASSIPFEQWQLGTGRPLERGLLTWPSTEVSWAPEAQVSGPDALLQGSYGIPYYLESLVRRLEDRVRGKASSVATLEDVKYVVAECAALPLFEVFDNQDVAHTPTSGSAGRAGKLQNLATRLVRDLLVHHHYDLADPSVEPKFTPNSASDLLQCHLHATLDALGRRWMEPYLEGIVMEEVLQDLCVSSYLTCDDDCGPPGEQIYRFDDDIYPRALQRAGKSAHRRTSKWTSALLSTLKTEATRTPQEAPEP